MALSKIFENLKGLVNVDIKFPDNIKLPDINIAIGNRQDIVIIEKSSNTILSDPVNPAHSEYLYDKKNKRLHIIPENLSPKKKEELDKLLHEYIADGGKLLEEKTVNTLARLDEYYKNSSDDNKIKDFFKGIIPPQDLEALEASLFLRGEFGKRNPVSELKEDIVHRFGDRGNNISNLCTSGYFEGFLKPLYNQDKEQFKKTYELAVTDHLVVFVNEHMSETKIGLDIESKMNACKRYGIGFLHIHGIGKKNVATIKGYIQRKMGFFSLFSKKIYESKNKDIITVELLLDE